ncbi:HAMP domain-containing sensor histidine kinase [Streptomyces sp. ME02-8801-2C]|uniref:sensor histidine kinase n=1 Tax=Streptomyces sp. ME02-8801-2C TaxID=3028680 RepID=UPI0029BE79E0|nr:HAMP domain-containing sensor histidine kinase [Streptomyces sp. ME02-8801-2C]MDX3453518.1 HAMP domain-containing sensor histidine kinase [Streptomyces sp. ME02-8801-2C]
MRRRDKARATSARLPLRRSLAGRLLTVTALVASCSVAATAWLAVQTTTVAIRQEQGQNLKSDAQIYNTLLGYAATHPDWDGVDATVRDLAQQSGRRIVLTNEGRRPFVDSADSPSAKGGSPPATLAPQASAVVDPLSVDTVLVPDAAKAGADRVDPRAVGPFRLPAAERAALRKASAGQVECLNRLGIAADLVESPGGRTRVQFVSEENGTDSEVDRSTQAKCLEGFETGATPTERKALKALNQLADACLKRQGRTAVQLNLDLSWNRAYGTPYGQDYEALSDAEATRRKRAAAEEALLAAKREEDAEAAERKAAAGGAIDYVPSEFRDSGYDRAVAACVVSARREQLTAYVAGPALLFIDGPGAAGVPGFDLSPANTARIAGVTALVLALTVGASVLAGGRLVRPLHALTGAAQRMRDGLDSTPVPVPVVSDNEIGRLTAAFNDMAAHRARLEEQRKVMVSDVAHELRTPLSNIRGWLEAAHDGLAQPDPAFVSSLLEEAVQLQHLINDLQDLGAADAGALRLHRKPVRIDELLGQVASAHQGLAETAGVSLTVLPTTGPGLPLLDADPVRLRQTVSNLLSNAVRHTPAGGRVTLRSYVTDTGEQLAVEVSDTGTGIPAADLPYVFDRFWRAEKSRSRSTGGSGLGLAIVLKLAEAHGGTVDVTSTEGEGATFTLRLPTAAAAGTGRDPDGMTTAT